jgi:Skp family chaperone for outer membrane proteins
MKKLVTVLALALATSAVWAQTATQVSVYGKVRVYEES